MRRLRRIGKLSYLGSRRKKNVADREITMAQIESIERQAEEDREAKSAKFEGDKQD